MNINIKYLPEYIEKNEFLIVGSPKGVGFSTVIAEWIAYKIFFEEEYSILVLTCNRKDKIDMTFKIRKAMEYYQYPLENDYSDKNILYTKGELGSGVCIMSYHELNFDTITEKFDLIVVDKDDFSDYLYNNLETLIYSSEKMVFNTYDVPHSIFHNYDGEKIVLASEHSKENIKNNIGKYPMRINYDRILLGNFK